MEVTQEMQKKVDEHKEQQRINKQIELLELIAKKIKNNEMDITMWEFDWVEGLRISLYPAKEVGEKVANLYSN